MTDTEIDKRPPDTDGPRGTYGCACVDRDAVQCAAIRYGMDHWGEPCECLCHQWDDDDDLRHRNRPPVGAGYWV